MVVGRVRSTAGWGKAAAPHEGERGVGRGRGTTRGGVGVGVGVGVGWITRCGGNEERRRWLVWVRGGDLVTDLVSNLGLDIGVQFEGDVVHQGVTYE